MDILIVDPTRRPNSHYNISAARTQNLGKFRHLVSLANHLHQYGVNVHYASFLPTNISEEGGINYYNIRDSKAISSIREDTAIIVDDPCPWVNVTSPSARRIFLPLDNIWPEVPREVDMTVALSESHLRDMYQHEMQKIVVCPFGITNELYQGYPQKSNSVLFVGSCHTGLHEARLFWNSFSQGAGKDMEFVVVTPETEGPDVDALRDTATVYHNIPHPELVSLMGSSLFAIRPTSRRSHFDSTALECMCSSTPIIGIGKNDHVTDLIDEHGVGMETRYGYHIPAASQIHNLVHLATNFLKDYDTQTYMADKGTNMLYSGYYDWRGCLNAWAELLCT